MPKIKRCKVTTVTPCPRCLKGDDVWGGRKGLNTTYLCHYCRHSWEVSPEGCVWKKWNIPDGVCFCVFNGLWLAEEMRLVAAGAFRYSKRQREEWGWYKGRHFYTAWQLGMNTPICLEKTLPLLIHKVAELCKPSRTL